jgi:DNA-binding response OmpR family regulator
LLSIFHLTSSSSSTLLVLRKIAVVDDESELAELYTEAIRTQGYSVRPFSDPLMALQEICSNPSDYSLLVVDIKMAVMNGIDLVTQIHIKNNKIKIIFISGDTQFEKKDLRFPLLIKPFKISKLLEVVNNTFKVNKTD